jgi:DNA polymerase-1
VTPIAECIRTYPILDAARALSAAQVSGRVHADLDPLGSETGRFTCRNPRLLSLASEIRSAIVARPGHRLIELDFAQFELRVVAQLSGDPQLSNILCAPGSDVYVSLAAVLFGKPATAVTDSDRRMAKRVFLGVVYGQQARSLAEELNVDTRRAQEISALVTSSFPATFSWASAIQDQAQRAGYVTTLYGRRRRLLGLQSADQAEHRIALRQAVNTAVQGTAADIFKLALARLASSLPGDRHLLLPIHDAVLLEAPENDVREAVRQAKAILEAPPLNFGIPLMVRAKEGPRWSTCQPIDA